MHSPDALRSRLAAERPTLSLLALCGSKAYGIDVEGSDDDYVGVFVPALRDAVSIHGIARATITGRDPDFTLHEIGKFCHLALKGNPAILEALGCPDVLEADRWGRALIV